MPRHDHGRSYPRLGAKSAVITRGGRRVPAKLALYRTLGGTLPAATMARRIGIASRAKNPMTKNEISEMIAAW